MMSAAVTLTPANGLFRSFVPWLPRHTVIVLCTICSYINYCDRITMSVAVLSMQAELHFTVAHKGALLSSFFWGYLVSQLCGALLARSVGGKQALTWAVCIWSALTMLTPFAAYQSYFALLVCRGALGVAEGLAFPVIYHLLGKWVPSHERTRAVTAVSSGVQLGSTTAFLISPWLMRQYGWQSVFYVFGIVGFIWAYAWQILILDEEIAPKQEDEIEIRRSDEVQLLADAVTVNANIQPKIVSPSKEESVYNVFQTVVAIFTSIPLLTVIVVQFCYVWCQYILSAWLPTYFSEVLNSESGEHVFWPYLFMACTSFIGGYISDQLLLVELKWKLLTIRKVMSTLGFTLSASFLILFSLSYQSISLSTIYMCLTLSSATLSLSGWSANTLDLVSSEHAGLFMAVSNTVATLAGVIGVPLVAHILSHPEYGGWNRVFCMIAAVQFIAAALYLLGARATKVKLPSVK